jgi:2-polyprenyl-3-methyl-5-hydroxy-6-metoxy-1,4-benzoquinol methylase
MSTSVDWQQETIRYDRPHPRLVRMAGLLARFPQRKLLDVGCSTAAMRRVLPPEFEYYGCDIADHAAAALGADRFRQIDFNQTCDLSAFAGRQIDLIHIGGVLEYLDRPCELLRALRELVGAGAGMVLSIINFEERRYRDPASHHPGWVFQPRLDELRQMLHEQGWQIEQQLAFFGRGEFRERLFGAAAACLGMDHRWVRHRARQFILTAKSR